MAAKVKVLIVDDNPLDVETIRRMLGRYEALDFEPTSAGSTEECADLVRNQSFDLVLLDQNLPGESGLSFLERTSRAGEFPPTIMLTGSGNERLAVDAMQQGALDYFPKQFISSAVLGHAIHKAIEKDVLNRQLERTEDVIFILAAAVEAKDPTTGAHLQRMVDSSQQLGQALGLDNKELTVLRYGAVLHDIGKVSVSEAILRKPGALIEEEWAEMRLHPVIGEKICQPLRHAHSVSLIIRHHHERWDGTGYADGLAGEDIPHLARLVAIVDAFDAMTNDRPYRPALSLEEASERLTAGAGSQWDPDMTPIFVDKVAPALLTHS